MGGHDEKLKNFAKSKKKIGDLYELDNFKQKCPPHHLSNPQGYRDTTI